MRYRPLKYSRSSTQNFMDFQIHYIFQLDHPPLFAISCANTRERRQKSGKNVGSLQTGSLILFAKRPRRKRKAPAFVSRLLLAAFCFKNGLFGDPGAIRTRDVPLRRRKKRSPSLPSNVPQVLDVTWFLTISGRSHFLQKAPLLPQCDQQEISRANFGGGTFSRIIRQNQQVDRNHVFEIPSIYGKKFSIIKLDTML